MTFEDFKNGVTAVKGTSAPPDEAEMKRAWQLGIDPADYWQSWIQLAMYNGEQSGAERMILAHESLKLQRRLVEAVEKLASDRTLLAIAGNIVAAGRWAGDNYGGGVCSPMAEAREHIQELGTPLNL